MIQRASSNQRYSFNYQQATSSQFSCLVKSGSLSISSKLNNKEESIVAVLYSEKILNFIHLTIKNKLQQHDSNFNSDNNK